MRQALQREASGLLTIITLALVVGSVATWAAIAIDYMANGY